MSETADEPEIVYQDDGSKDDIGTVEFEPEVEELADGSYQAVLVRLRYGLIEHTEDRIVYGWFRDTVFKVHEANVQDAGYTLGECMGMIHQRKVEAEAGGSNSPVEDDDGDGE